MELELECGGIVDEIGAGSADAKENEMYGLVQNFEGGGQREQIVGGAAQGSDLWKKNTFFHLNAIFIVIITFVAT